MYRLQSIGMLLPRNGSKGRLKEILEIGDYTHERYRLWRQNRLKP